MGFTIFRCMNPGSYYHVFNHANGDENLFREEDNYHYFLKQWAKYIEPVADTYAYCLMPNHFHALVRTKDFRQSDLQGFQNLEGLKNQEPSKRIIQAFSNLFNSYSKAYNKMYDRRGSLFEHGFKRKEITSDAYLTAVMVYIHHNPVHHGFCDRIENWPHSSFHSLLSSQPSKLARQAVLDWFGDAVGFRQSHRVMLELPDHSLLIDF